MENHILRFILNAIFEGGIFTAFLAIVIFLFKEKFKALIQCSIKHLFDMKLEDYKSRELKRQKAILIAEVREIMMGEEEKIDSTHLIIFEKE